MNHLKSILTRGTPRNTSLGGGKWTPANAEESAQKSPAWSQMPRTLFDVPWKKWKLLEVVVPLAILCDLFGMVQWATSNWGIKMSLWITWPLVIKATVIGFEGVFSSKINFCIFGKQFTIYSRGFNQECGGVEHIWEVGPKPAATQKKQNHWMLTSSKMDSQSQNHYLVVYPWGIFMIIFGPYDCVYKPYQNQPGFWVWPTILENQIQPFDTFFRVSRQDGHSRHHEEGRGRHSGSDRWSFLDKAESTWWQTWYSDRS